MISTQQYNWYDIIEADEQLLQGDFINDCPVIEPGADYSEGCTELTGKIGLYNVIVMSQSCDLVNKKLDLVLVCPYWSLESIGGGSKFGTNEGKESLRKGNQPAYHMLNKIDIEGYNTDFLVVDFRNIYAIPVNFLFDFVKEKGKRVRLLPPYREHLSQAFARFFMRVGLPTDIPSFK